MTGVKGPMQQRIELWLDVARGRQPPRLGNEDLESDPDVLVSRSNAAGESRRISAQARQDRDDIAGRQGHRTPPHKCARCRDETAQYARSAPTAPGEMQVRFCGRGRGPGVTY